MLKRILTNLPYQDLVLVALLAAMALALAANTFDQLGLQKRAILIEERLVALETAPAPVEREQLTAPKTAAGPVVGAARGIPLHQHNDLVFRGTIATETATDIICPKCGGGPVMKDMTVVLTSYPAQYRVRCAKCGWSGTCN